jgi:polar amino acid transport system substrate-binding protein
MDINYGYYSMRKIITLFFFLLLLLSSHLVANTALSKVTLQLQWKHQFEFAGFYAAKEMGFYKEVGLDVEFREYDNKQSIVESVLNQKAHFGLTYSSLIAQYLKGKEVVFIANYFKQSPLVIVAQPHIKTPAMLKGKRMMGVSDNIDNITLKLMLEKFGIALSEIQNIPTSYSIKEFANKEVDALAVFTTNEIYHLDQQGIKYNVFNPSLYGHEYYDVNLFTSKSYALNYPDRVQKFREATKKGWEYALKHKEKIVELILQKYNSQNKSREALLFEAHQIEQLMFTKTETIGDIDPLRVQLIAKNFIQSGYVDAKHLKNLEHLIFTHSTQKSELNLEEKEYLKNRIIKVGMVNDYYPFSFKENGKINGFSYEYFKLLASKVGMHYDIELTSWSQNLTNFKNRTIDIIDAISYSVEREAYTNFSQPYFSIPNVIFTRKGSIVKYQGLHTLKNKKVGITKGIYYYDAVKRLGLFNLVPFESSRQKMKALAFGKIDAVMNSMTSGQRYILQGGYTNIEILDEISDDIVKKEDLRLGIAKENALLYSIIQKATKLISPNEKLKLIHKYFGSKVGTSILTPKERALTLAQNPLKLSTQEQNYLANKEHITMCVDPDWEPYELIDKQGRHRGLAADFIELIESKINKKITLIPTKTWKQSLEAAKNKQCEILSFLNPSPDREKYLNFTPTLYSEPEVIVAKDEVTYLDGIAALEGKTVGLVKGYRTDEHISKNYPKVKIKHIKNYEEGIKLVSQGRLYATVNSLLGTAHLIRKSNLIDIKIAGKTQLLNDYRIGIIKSDAMLHAILSKAVSQVSQKERDKILSNWISVKFEQGIDYTLIWRILLVVSIIILLLYYRQYAINKLNRELKAQMEAQLQSIVEKDRMIFEQNKLVAMGEMLENIAHQWRQPLSQINSAVMLIDLEMSNNKSALVESKLSEIESMTSYLSNTIDDFRNFYAKDKAKEHFNVANRIEKTLAILDASLKHHTIEVEKHLDRTIEITSLPNELQQALLILLNNAKDVLVARNIQKPKITIALVKTFNALTITVSDNAGGIEDKHLSKVFEPYFTTKHKSKGTGLGLYIAKLIIEESLGGALEVENTSIGASFTIECRAN